MSVECVECSGPALDFVSVAIGVCLLLASHPAYSQTPDLVFRGTPEHKIESYEDEDVRHQLDSQAAAEAEVVIVAT